MLYQILNSKIKRILSDSGEKMIKKIQKENLNKLINNLLSKDYLIIAPVRKKGFVTFSKISDFNEIAMDYIQSSLSPKGVLFPSAEEILKYQNLEGSVKIFEAEIPENNIILFGIKPCDAIGLDYLSTFFLKENTDKYFKLRKEKTTVISLSCKEADSFCFCSSVGISPSDTRGTDLLLTDTGDGFYSEFMSDKGINLHNQFGDLFVEAPQVDKSKFTAKPEIVFNLEQVLSKTSKLYNEELWKEHSLSCLGCGACAFSCPTCSCYDIQDESNPFGGRRIKNWDTCGLGLFTIHASGHNPRNVQSNRWRHRVLHKFDYSVKNMDTVSCVGCGRCIRVCPGGMNIIETLQTIAG